MGFCDGIRSLSVFCYWRTALSEGQATRYAVLYCCRSLYPRSREETTRLDDFSKFEGTWLWKLRGKNAWQWTPWSEEVGIRYDLDSRGSTSSYKPSHEQETTRLWQDLQITWFYLVLKVWCVQTRLLFRSHLVLFFSLSCLTMQLTGDPVLLQMNRMILQSNFHLQKLEHISSVSNE